MDSTLKTSLRDANDADSELAYAVKKTAFSEYVTKQYGDWDEAEQRNYHRKRFASQDFKVIEIDSETVGVLALVTEPAALILNSS